ncbi:MAG: hypothetical protein HKN41_02190 [Ilumatobacter sp.]|nr:hypothetical protein [Ilumatobacter sp.]
MHETRTQHGPASLEPPTDPPTRSTLAVATAAGVRVGDSVELAGRSVTDVVDSPLGPIALCGGRDLLVRTGGDWSLVASLEGGGGRRIGVTGRAVFVGGSEARLWRLDGSRLERVAAFDRAPTSAEWHTPWGGPPDVYAFASDGDRLYVGVHVGGILRSDDLGSTWSDTIDLHLDVHDVAVDAAGEVWAATGRRALARSTDGGATWEHVTDGLHARYALAVAVGPAGPIVGVSSGPFARDGRVYRWDGGRLVAVEGLPDDLEGAVGPGLITADGSTAAVALPNGVVYTSDDAGMTWAPSGAAFGTVHALAFVDV